MRFGTVPQIQCLADLLARSLASRSAVRFRAAAKEAFLARAERSSGVRFWADAWPPSLPYFFPSALRYLSTSGGIRLAMLQSYARKVLT